MAPNTIRFDTTILPGHRIELSAPELPEGYSATVFVVVTKPALAKRRLSEILANYQGGQLFHTADEVDAYIRAERDSWDN
jgi:hypothetical protein